MSYELSVADRGPGTCLVPNPLAIPRSTPGEDARRGASARWVRAAANTALSAVAVAAVAALLLVAVGPRVADYRTIVMLTGSMTPAYPSGSLLILTPQPTEDLAKGDVLTYRVPVGDRPVVTHRVVKVERDPAGVQVQTKGDANPARDPWVATITDETVWTARGAVPGAGQVIGWARSGNLRPITTLVLPSVMVGWFLIGIWRKRPEDATS